MSLPILFSDLDLTLIYSIRQLQTHNQVSAGNLVSEDYENKPLSFISLTTWKQLVKFAGQEFLFVPTTTRTLRQYRRVTLPDVKIPASIVLNGARILIDGEEDYSWTKQVASEIKHLDVHPVRVSELLKAELGGLDYVTNIVSADDFFTYVVTKTTESPEVDAYTTALAEEIGYVRSKQGRKTYLVPSTISKGRAVRELANRFGSELTFAAGDSILDFSMITEVNHFLHPVHGDTPPVAGNVTQTVNRGITASEDILDFVRDTLNLSL